MLVKRYLRTGDAYVHADVHGAASCIVRAKWGTSKDSRDDKPRPLPISHFALQEAGAASVCRSSAWSARIITSAWWVGADQVSKSAPTGEYLSTGSFMIYGRKNFLPPASLEFAFGIMFRLDDSSVKRHMGERRDKDVTMDEDAMSLFSEHMDRYGLDTGASTVDGLVNNGSVSGSVSAMPHEAPQQKARGSEKKARKEKERENEKDGGLDSGGGAQVGSKTLAPPADESANGTKKKKKLSKAKARRYADQDDEDRQLAMIALGHLKLDNAGGGAQGKKKDRERAKGSAAGGAGTGKSDEALEKRLQRAGVHLVKQDWEAARDGLSARVRARWDGLVSDGLVTEGEGTGGVDVFELKSLAALSEDKGMEVLSLVREGLEEKGGRVGNMSAFVAGIVRRVATLKEDGGRSEAVEGEGEGEGAMEGPEKEGDGGDAARAPNISRTQRNKAQAKEIQQILSEEGVLEAEEGKAADDLEKLTGVPHADDSLLYAIPVCGPFASLDSFKYRIKLTAGSQKKGKAAKMALELFTRDQGGICTPRERALMKQLSDPEMVAIMLGDVKLSAPGLFAAQRAQKGKSSQPRKKPSKGGGGKKK